MSKSLLILVLFTCSCFPGVYGDLYVNFKREAELLHDGMTQGSDKIKDGLGGVSSQLANSLPRVGSDAAATIEKALNQFGYQLTKVGLESTQFFSNATILSLDSFGRQHVLATENLIEASKNVQKAVDELTYQLGSIGLESIQLLSLTLFKLGNSSFVPLDSFGRQNVKATKNLLEASKNVQNVFSSAWFGVLVGTVSFVFVSSGLFLLFYTATLAAKLCRSKSRPPVNPQARYPIHSGYYQLVDAS